MSDTTDVAQGPTAGRSILIGRTVCRLHVMRASAPRGPAILDVSLALVTSGLDTRLDLGAAAMPQRNAHLERRKEDTTTPSCAPPCPHQSNARGDPVRRYLHGHTGSSGS